MKGSFHNSPNMFIIDIIDIIVTPICTKPCTYFLNKPVLITH